MLGLPSTTEVNRRFPKESFYSHLKLDRKTRDQFVSGIERITMTNSVKPGTANVIDGKNIHEIMVFKVEMKMRELPLLALERIAEANSNGIVFVCEYDDDAKTVVFRQGKHVSDGMVSLSLNAETMDAIWDSFVSQIVFGEPTQGSLDKRIERTRRIKELDVEISRLRDKCMKSKQINKKNELFEQMKNKKSELDALKKGE